MTSNEAKRLAVVGDLLVLGKPLEKIAGQLAAMGWDFEGDGVELQRQHLQAVLHRFLEAAMTAKDVEVWANLIEGREDVYFQTGSEEQIEAVLYELANPLLTQVLDQERATALLSVLA